MALTAKLRSNGGFERETKPITMNVKLRKTTLNIIIEKKTWRLWNAMLKMDNSKRWNWEWMVALNAMLKMDNSKGWNWEWMVALNAELKTNDEGGKYALV